MPAALPDGLFAGDVETAAAHVQRLIAFPEERRAMGVAARAEVSKWDWRAATLHLLHHQYPLAVAAAAAVYGTKIGAAAAAVAGSEQKDAGAPATALVAA